MVFSHRAEKPVRQNKPLACSHTIAEQIRASQQQMYSHSRSVCQVKYADAPGGCLVALFSKGLHIVHHIYSISRFFKRSIIKMLKKFQPYIQVPLNPVSKQDSTSATAELRVHITTHLL